MQARPDQAGGQQTCNGAARVHSCSPSLGEGKPSGPAAEGEGLSSQADDWGRGAETAKDSSERPWGYRSSEAGQGQKVPKAGVWGRAPVIRLVASRLY